MDIERANVPGKGIRIKIWNRGSLFSFNIGIHSPAGFFGQCSMFFKDLLGMFQRAIETFWMLTASVYIIRNTHSLRPTHLENADTRVWYIKSWICRCDGSGVWNAIGESIHSDGWTSRFQQWGIPKPFQLCVLPIPTSRIWKRTSLFLFGRETWLLCALPCSGLLRKACNGPTILVSLLVFLRPNPDKFSDVVELTYPVRQGHDPSRSHDFLEELSWNPGLII